MTERPIACLKCGLKQPATEFRVLSLQGKQERSDFCNTCLERELQEVRRQRENNALIPTQELGEHAVAALHRRPDLPHIGELTAGLIRAGGGMDFVINLYWNQLNAAMDERPGSPTVLRSFDNLFALIARATDHMDTAPNVEDMSSDEMRRQLKTFAAQQGYELVPKANIAEVPAK